MLLLVAAVLVLGPCMCLAEPDKYKVSGGSASGKQQRSLFFRWHGNCFLVDSVGLRSAMLQC